MKYASLYRNETDIGNPVPVEKRWRASDMLGKNLFKLKALRNLCSGSKLGDETICLIAGYNKKRDYDPVRS